MKRGRGDQLTGGSRDVNPQEFVMPLLTQTGNDATTVVSAPLPIPRLPTKSGKSLVIEILWVEFHFVITGLAAAVQTLYLALTTNATGQANITAALRDPRVIAQHYTGYVYAAATALNIADGYSHEIDLTDQAGHGIIVATDTIYGVIMSTGTNAANNGVIRFGYRWKEVSLEEYIGVVQSQQ